MEAKESSLLNAKLSRRTFVKASAATAVVVGAATTNPWSPAMTALAEVEKSDIIASSDEKVFSGACRGNCAGGCFLNIHVRGGKVVRTSMREMPNPDYNRICVKGLTHMQRIYHKDRLKYPMKRIGERGAGQWERISWDEAVTTIADKWQEYQREYGKEAFAIYWGSGNYGVLSGQGMGCTTNRLLNVTGASNISMTVDAAHGHSAGNALGWGPNFTLNELADLKNAKTILCWGANPVISQQQSTHFLMEAKENGTTFIVIDPIYNITASKADKFVPVRPGTDGALALGMMNIVVRENWIDVPFLKASTVAPFLVKEADGHYLRLSDLGPLAEGQRDDIVVRSAGGKMGLPQEITDPVIEGSFEINGHKVNTAYTLLLQRIGEYPPEKAAEICNISVSQIEEITKIYATNKPSTIYQYFGIDHYVNGHYSIFDIYALAMITGNLGKSGAACGMGETLGINFTNLAGTLFPAGATGPSLTMSATQMDSVMNEHKYGNKDVNVKGIYITNANVVANSAERKYTLDWLNKMEFIAVADMNMNETAQYADILLPVSHWFEQEEAFCNYSTHPYVIFQEKAIDPLYECKADFEINKLIAQKLGYGEQFNLTEMEYLNLWLDNDEARRLGITLEALREKRILKCLPGDLYINGENGVFATPTGRAQFYVENPAPNMNYDQQWDIEKERLPYWEPPNEVWHENPLTKKYPFTIISDHVRFRTHTQWWDVPALLELDPEPILKISSEDAAQYGIKTNDLVKIYNDRGHVVMKAAINDGLPQGVLTAPKGWEKHQFREGHFADLSSRVVNKVCANSAFFDVLVAIEKL
ncbi:molybdopterin-containing oxidoreductase family molybdopterin binding subunit [Desulfitobacterium sp. LBE]|uniref:molybdopterin-dependent oxidoreductase n=1 Tax=Desulfitobacterium sp. LBE TaxID=884086 RepID=UPI00119A3301|nr:molybdopterin-dependent oxidoreductase [Desulfitobacterium sp. LBE]TWH59990.1 molybdopterin-containing oxidoreductase family molybdopterin binding subunit [Desulfitobacterium sp. LBE]